MVKKKNLLVTGSDGQLGKSLKDISNQFDFRYFFMSRDKLDITDPLKLEVFLKKFKIEVVINCAAFTDVSKAEDNKYYSNIINNIAVGYLAALCNKFDIKLIHISTDYVFDGNTNFSYVETDKVNPLNYYGITKLRGENKILSHKLKNSIIIRTSVLYYHNGNSFVNKIINKIKNKEDIEVVNDQYSAPTYAHDLSKVIFKIIPMIKNDTTQIYHFSNFGQCSRYEIAVEINKLINGSSIIKPIKSLNNITVRPSFSVLNTKKIIDNFNLEIRSWNTALKDFISTQKIILSEV